VPISPAQQRREVFSDWVFRTIVAFRSAKERLFAERKATICRPCSVKILHGVARSGAEDARDPPRFFPLLATPAEVDCVNWRLFAATAKLKCTNGSESQGVAKASATLLTLDGLTGSCFSNAILD
jgi:hypothetical protein